MSIKKIYFLSGALADLLFSRAEPFVQCGSSGGPPDQWSRTIYAILKEGIMGTIHVKLYEFGPVVQEEMLFKEKVSGRGMHARQKTDHNTSP